jgi:hypothetical protein
MCGVLGLAVAGRPGRFAYSRTLSSKLASSPTQFGLFPLVMMSRTRSRHARRLRATLGNAAHKESIEVDADQVARASLFTPFVMDGA